MHLGHQVVFSEVKRLAKEKGAQPGVLTFYPHPMKVLAPDIHVPLLQSIDEKMDALAAQGMALAVCIRPDETFLAKSAEDFLEELARLPGLVGLVTGENFSFGHGGLGKSGDLVRFFEESRVTSASSHSERTQEEDFQHRHPPVHPRGRDGAGGALSGTSLHDPG